MKKLKVDIFAEFQKLQEAAPAGSLEGLRDKICAALNIKKFFGDFNYVIYTFLDKVIFDAQGKKYQINFGFNEKGEVVFTGEPVEVEEVFIVKESLRESFEIIKEAQEMDVEVSNFVNLAEAIYNEKSGEFEKVILIEAGTSEEKMRHYPESTIQEAATQFSGLKMYINHPTKTEEKERPERNLRDWVSTIVESHAEGGKAVAKIAVHDMWLRERLQDKIARKHIGLSILTGGKVAMGRINGKEMQIVEKIILKRQNGPASVDWVTEAGARGRVYELFESRKEGIQMFEKATLEQLQQERPDLVTQIKEGATTEIKEAQGRAEVAEKQLKLNRQKEKISVLLKESKLPEAAQSRVIAQIAETVFESDEKLKESVDGLVKKEREYINTLSEKGKISLNGSDKSQATIRETMTKELSAQLGQNEVTDKVLKGGMSKHG